MDPSQPSSRPRRLTPRDLLVIVAIIAFPLAAVGSALRADLKPATRAAVAAVALGGPALIGLIWAIAGWRPSRWQERLEGPWLLLYMLVTMATIVLLVALYLAYPPAAILVGAAMLALLAYFISWL